MTDYEEPMPPEDYPEPPMPEEMPSSSEPTSTSAPEMSLEEFQNLSPEEQAAIWQTIQATKADTTEILSLVQPKGQGEDPLLPLIQQMVEISIRTEEKIDSETQTNEEFRQEMRQKIQMVLDCI